MFLLDSSPFSDDFETKSYWLETLIAPLPVELNIATGVFTFCLMLALPLCLNTHSHTLSLTPLHLYPPSHTHSHTFSPAGTRRDLADVGTQAK